MSNTNLTSMEHYITFSERTGRWCVEVPINGSENQKTEYAGDYATKSEADLAVKSFFDCVSLSPPPNSFAYNHETIKALRLHVAALEKERNELKEDLTYKKKNVFLLRSSYLSLASRVGDSEWSEAQGVLAVCDKRASDAINAKMREQTPPPSGGGGGGGVVDDAMGWEDDYDDQEDFPSVRGYMPSLNGYDT